MLTLETFRRNLDSLVAHHSITHFVVAYSGGMDSHALLHLCAQLNLPLRALHIHHGLQTEADQWSDHCMAVCKSLNVSCQTLHVDAVPLPGESPEQGARRARYQALLENLSAKACLLTAHHKDDQSETVLLQLLRGAGPAGLAAMPALKTVANGWHARPLLAFSREDIAQYAQEHKLDWVDDPSNSNTDFDRNFIRQTVLPAIRQRWPQADDSMTQAASQQQDSLKIIETLAATDLAAVITQDMAVLSVEKLIALPRERQLNVLRYWLRRNEYDRPTRNVLLQIVNNVLNAAEDAEPLVRWCRTEVRRYQNRLYLLPVTGARNDITSHQWDLQHDLVLDELGIKLSVSTATGQGLRSSLLDQPMTVRFRRGGETIKPTGSKHTHSLKKLMQDASIPPWQRDRIPLLYCNNELICVCGYWLADAQSVKEAGLSGWQPVIKRL